MPFDNNTTFEISTRGQIDDAAIKRARERLSRVARHCREVITHAEMRVTEERTHPAQDHASAEATLSVKRGPVRAHAHAPSVAEAIDLMIHRLRRRVDRHESRLHRIGTKRLDGVAVEGTWHHGDVSATPRHPLPRLDEPATIVRRKTFAVSPMSVEEAAFDLEILDHDFYLFEEAESGAGALLSLQGDGRYRLEVSAEAEIDLRGSLPIDRRCGPMVLDQQGANHLLDSTLDSWIFHRVAPDHAGQVTYRRYDGQYGVIEPAP